MEDFWGGVVRYWMNWSGWERGLMCLISSLDDCLCGMGFFFVDDVGIF